MNDLHDVIDHALVDVQLGDVAAGLEDLFRRGDAIDRDRFTARHPSQHFFFFVARWIPDVEFQHEAVDLRFG